MICWVVINFWHLYSILHVCLFPVKKSARPFFSMHSCFLGQLRCCTKTTFTPDSQFNLFNFRLEFSFYFVGLGWYYRFIVIFQLMIWRSTHHNRIDIRNQINLDCFLHILVSFRMSEKWNWITWLEHCRLRTGKCPRQDNKHAKTCFCIDWYILSELKYFLLFVCLCCIFIPQ